jgi:hypothetical protein
MKVVYNDNTIIHGEKFLPVLKSMVSDFSSFHER